MDIEKFKKAFKGSNIAYGQYKSGETNDNGKQGGKAFIVKEKPTDELWKNHLEGKEPSLGIIPIDENNKCHWGCIDVDEYPLDHKKILKRIQKFKIPLIMCRSKSGGAHLFIFVNKPVTAKIMQTKLKEISSGLGYSHCEIFPKQTNILVERGDTGNFLNLPFHNANASLRYAFNEDGSAATLEEFFILYDKFVMNPEDIFKIKIAVEEEAIKLGPPCLQHLCKQDFPQGTRNSGLFNLGVYARKAFPDKWEEKVEEYNRKYMNPPLPSEEVTTIKKSLSNKNYIYTCKDEPIHSHCNSELCKTRKYGVGSGYIPQIGNLTKQNSEPPIWFLSVEGKRIELETDDLQNQLRFQKVCMDTLNTMPSKMASRDWTVLVQALLEEVTIIEVPEEVGLTGQFKDLLEDFCTNIGEALTKEEILLGKPFTDNTKTYFRLGDLQNYLHKHNFRNFGRNKIVSSLKDLGAKYTSFIIKDRFTRVWEIPEFKKEESIDTPIFIKKEDPF